MKSNKILYSIILLLITLSSCNYENPLDTEQYKKSIYLIGASKTLITKELRYNVEGQEAFITVGVSGSLLLDKDVTVHLSSHNSVLNWYNKKYKFLTTDIRYRELTPDFYNIPSYTTTLKAGEVYARLPIKIRTEGLHCDSLYALTFKIDSSSDYEVNRTDSALLVTFSLANDLSGNYIFKGFRHELNSINETVASTSVNIFRTLKATDENSVRFYNEQQAETIANIKKYGVVLSLDANNRVAISSWEDFDLVGGTCTYNKDSKVFDVNYKYRQDGKTYLMEGSFTYQEEGEV